MSKDRLQKDYQEVETCDVCGHSAPLHGLTCPKVRGLYCKECEAMLPRHYPHCLIGKRDGFLGWQMPRGAQRDVEGMYNVKMKARAAALYGEK